MTRIAAALHPDVLIGDDRLSATADAVGGKARNLARLVGAGAAVPDWVVVSAPAWRRQMERLSPGGRATLARLRGLAASAADAEAAIARAVRVADEVVAVGLDPELRCAVSGILDELGPGPFAVRSSVVGEDGSAHSHAGQFASFLSLTDEREVAGALLRCWASPFSRRALTYRLRAGLCAVPSGVGVIIQRMAAGSVSGVLFTADPVAGRRDRMRLSACWGLGEGLVGGVCEADDWVCLPSGEEESMAVATKSVQVVADPAGGTAERPVPEDLRSIRCLTPGDVATICAEGARLERAFGAPQDIEWTMEHGRLRILQARPITTLPPDGPVTVWDNSNIQESYCGVTTPLTFSFAVAAYASVYEQTMRAVRLPESVIRAHRPLLRGLLGLLRGRIYYDIGQWYRGLLLLPSFGRNKADMEAMMGLDEPVELIRDERLTTAQKLRRLPRLALTALHLGLRFARLERDTAAFLRRFDAACDAFDRDGLADAPLTRLMETLHALRRDLLERWSTPIVNDFHVMMATGRLRRMVARAAGAAAEERVQELLTGIEGMESVEPARRLMALAAAARREPALEAALRNGDPATAWATLTERHPAFMAELNAYLHRYGDRCMGELKLETVSLREDPTPAVRMLRTYLDARLDPGAVAERQRARRLATEAELARALGPVAAFRFRRAVAAARRGIRDRENMRLARTRMFGLFRHVYRAVGRRLAEAGVLERAGDVFYLTTGEIEAHHEGRGVTGDLGALARMRRGEFEGYEDETLPNRIETRGAAGAWRPGPSAPVARPAPTGCVLRGTGCCAGVVEAPVHIVRSPDDDLDVGGRILTALRTDPGWAPLFPAAAGILVERGSTLSHSAVLARELGIPAVVGVPGLLEAVRHGERVRLDGARGIVERLEGTW